MSVVIIGSEVPSLTSGAQVQREVNELIFEAAVQNSEEVMRLGDWKLLRRCGDLQTLDQTEFTTVVFDDLLVK